MRRTLLGISICVLVLSLVGTSAAGSRVAQRAIATVSGSGTAVFPAWTPIRGDSEEVSVNARIAPDGSAKGHFHVIHHLASGGVSGHVGGVVTCLAVSGRTAVLSGVITNGKLPGVPGVDPIGASVALSIVDGGDVDAIGVDSSFAPVPHAVPDCEPVPPFLGVGSGDFVVSGG